MMAEEQSTIKRAPGHPHLERERQEKALQGAEKLYKEGVKIKGRNPECCLLEKKCYPIYFA